MISIHVVGVALHANHNLAVTDVYMCVQVLDHAPVHAFCFILLFLFYCLLFILIIILISDFCIVR